MINNKSTGSRIGGVFLKGNKQLAALGPIFCFTLLAAGCSADVKRFDDPPFGLTETGSTKSNPPTQSSDAGRYDDRNYARPAPNTNDSVRYSELPDISRRSEPNYANENYATTNEHSTKVAALSRGETIRVEQGDTLYGISRRHGVALTDLMAVNGLTTSELRPGQILYLPTGVSARRQTYRPDPGPAADVSAPSDWDGSYTVARGDSLYAIARQHNVTVSELQRNNSIDDPRRLRPGTVLRVPGYGSSVDNGYGSDSAGSSYDSVSNVPAKRNVHTVKTTRRPLTTMSGSNVEVLNAPSGSRVKTAALSPNNKSASSGSVTEKLRWPARGQIISNFGRRADGTHNDGVNLAVPMGSDVHSAEAGVVAYAGSELRGYGNLILIRHDNGWVTAYAHNAEMLVKREDKVSRGQVIAKAGKTGNVDRPQVHFELRQGSKPVDPLPYLEQL